MTTDSEARTRTTVGLTSEGSLALKKIMSSNWFLDEKDAFKFAVAFAIARDLDETQEPAGSFTTIWNRGTLDPDDQLGSLVALLRAPKDLWDSVRRLGDAGLRTMAEENVQLGLPTDVVENSG
jgi:hypothetical protein